ncbi:hypothetical protein BJX64DRAFT_292287 [Aspergillus heterothallicus]
MVEDAARSDDIRGRVFKVLLRRPSLHFSPDAAQHAARLWSADMMSQLFEAQGQKVHPTCGVVQAAAANKRHGVEVMAILQERGAAIRLTRSLVNTLFQNQCCGRKLLMQLLSDPGVYVGASGVEAIAGLFDVEVVELLLCRSAIRATNKACVAAARNSQGLRILEILFTHETEVLEVEDIAVAAAENEQAGWMVLQFLIHRGLRIPATDRVWKAAAGHKRHGRKIIGLLFKHQGKFLASEDVLVAAAGNPETGKLVIDFLLQQGTQLVLSDTILLSSISNKQHAKELLDIFFDKSRNELRLTEQIVPSFVEPPVREIPWLKSKKFDMCEAIFFILDREHKDRVTFSADALVRIMASGSYDLIYKLLETVGEKISITEEMIEAIAQVNDTSGAAEIVQCLFQHSPSVNVTKRAIIAAATRTSRGVDAIDAAICSRFWASELVEALLNQDPTVQITEKAVAGAGTHDMYDTSTFDRFLSKCRGEIRLSLQGLPYTLYDIATAPTIDFIKRALSESHGASVTGPLLEDAVRLDNSEIMASENAVGNSFAGKEIVQTLLAFNCRIDLTEPVVRSAAGIFSSGYEIIDLLLRDTERVRLLQSGVEAITALMPPNIVRLLFETRDKVGPMTTRMIEGAVKNSREVLDILVEAFGEFPLITDGILQAAASNVNSLRWIYDNYGDDVDCTQRAVEIAAGESMAALQVMLEQWGHEIRITTKVIGAVATSYSVCDTLSMLFNMRPKETCLSDDFWIALTASKYAWRAEEALEQLSEYCGFIRVSDDVVNAASRDGALRHGESLLKALLRNGKTRVTASGVEAIARSCDQKMFALLDEYHGRYIHVTERTLEAAAENPHSGWEIVEFLVRTRGKSRPWCTERVVEAAARNPRAGRDIVELLLCEYPDVRFASPGVLIAAAENTDKNMGAEIIDVLLSQREDEAVVTTAVVDAAIANSLFESIISDLRDLRTLQEDSDS